MKRLIFPVLLLLSWLFFFIFIKKGNKINDTYSQKIVDSLIIYQTMSKPEFIITSNAFEEELKKDSSRKFNKDEFNEDVNYEYIKVFYDFNNDIKKIEIIDYNTEVLVDYISKSKHTEFKGITIHPKFQVLSLINKRKVILLKKIGKFLSFYNYTFFHRYLSAHCSFLPFLLKF